MLRRASFNNFHHCNLNTLVASRVAFGHSVTAHLTDEQQQFVITAKSFAESHLQPLAGKWDREKIFPIAALREAASLGFAGIYASPEFGGTGLTRLDASLIFERNIEVLNKLGHEGWTKLGIAARLHN